MKLSFLGGAGTVTGSKYLLETADGRILVDCGMFQGISQLREKNWQAFPTKASEIDAIVLTHAHIDHSGYIPRLVREGYKGPIFCTAPTASLCRILLMDSAKLMEEEAHYANRRGYSKHKPAEPLFTSDDAAKALEQLRPIPFGNDHTIVGGLSVRFKHTGHILGAASVLIQTEGKRITFSGDVGRLQDPVMLSPEPLDAIDYLVVESTYGDRTHPNVDPESALQEAFETTWKNKGSVVIPAFAVGRAQQILYYIAKLKDSGKMPDFSVFLDSPMAVNATGLYCEFMRDHRMPREECKRTCEGAKYIRNLDESKALQTDPRPKIVISASGMATGGRVLHYLKKMLPDARNMVLFTGFQASGTRGASLVNGVSEIKIHGEYVPVNATVKNIENLSAHADSTEIRSWLKSSNLNPKTVFITHGEPNASQTLKDTLKTEFGWNCVVPKENEGFEI